MAPPFEVRRATHDDVEPALDLFTAVAEEGRWIGTEAGFDRAARAEQRHARIDDPEGGAAFVAVAEADGDDAVAGEARGGDRIIGDLGITLAGYGVADLGMVVDAAWRGQGVGDALLAAAVDWARSAGAHKVALQLWPHNMAARGLYEKHGFVEEGHLRRHYRRADGSLWDAVVMGLVLDETTPGGPGPCRVPPTDRAAGRDTLDRRRQGPEPLTGDGLRAHAGIVERVARRRRPDG